MNKKQFVAENFRLLEENNPAEGRRIRIFTRFSGIGEIPQALKDYIFDTYSTLFSDDSGWKRGNCDMGVFDAVLALHSSKKYIDVYVCGIIRRPFTDEESDQYELYFSGSLNYRLATTFDNHYLRDI